MGKGFDQKDWEKGVKEATSGYKVALVHYSFVVEAPT